MTALDLAFDLDLIRSPVRPDDYRTPSWITSDQEDYLYYKALKMMLQCRDATWLIKEVHPVMVIDFEPVVFGAPESTHRFKSEDIGIVETLVIVGTDNHVGLVYLKFEILDVPSPSVVKIRPIAEGHFAKNQLDDFYQIEESAVHQVDEITFNSDHPITRERIGQFGWYPNPDFKDLASVFMYFQNWAYGDF